MTRLRMTTDFTASNGTGFHAFAKGEEFDAALKTGGFWWTCADARTAFLVPDWACVEVAS